MNTFAQKQDLSRQEASSNSTKSRASTPQTEHVPQSILHLQRTIGNRVLQRLLPTNGEVSTTSVAPSLSAHNLRSSPVHTPAVRAIQMKGASNKLFGPHKREANYVRESAESGTSGGGGPLPHSDAIQRSFGRHDVSGIRAYVGGLASSAASAIGAARRPSQAATPKVETAHHLTGDS